MRLSDFRVLTFDVYGTLIDWESGMITALRPLIEKAGRALSRNDVLEAHAFHESEAQRQTPGKPYPRLLASVYKRLAEEWKVPVHWEDCLAYGRSVRRWPAFADSAEALRYLKRHYRLVVLSNVDNASFAESNTRLGVSFDAVYTAEDIGSYKPAARNFEFMLKQMARLGVDRREILHTAESMFHDHEPANRLGIANCLIYRRHDQQGFGATMPPGAAPKCDMVFNSMADMVAAHREEVASGERPR